MKTLSSLLQKTLEVFHSPPNPGGPAPDRKKKPLPRVRTDETRRELAGLLNVRPGDIFIQRQNRADGSVYTCYQITLKSPSGSLDLCITSDFLQLYLGRLTPRNGFTPQEICALLQEHFLSGYTPRSVEKALA